MNVNMVIPSYWGRKKSEGWKKTDSVYDHPTPLDEEGTLARTLESLSILKNREFRVFVLGVATAEDIREAVEQKITTIIQKTAPVVETQLFSYSHLEKIHNNLRDNNQEDFIPLLQLDGYSNVRNLCVFVPHLCGSEIAILIDDDELFEDPLFIEKALEFIGQNIDGHRILSVAGYYINPDNDFFLNREESPWMTHWNKFDCMNRAFEQTIAQDPRLKETSFAFGGNMVIHKDLFMQVPFDPSVPRGEDIDFLINARMFGFNTYLDNSLSIKHEPPPKTYPLWQRVREDILRFTFEKTKLDAQEPMDNMMTVQPEDLDPYPGEFLKDDLEEKVFRSNLMMAVDYINQGESEAAKECMVNIQLANKALQPKVNPFHRLIGLQKNWQALMEYFATERNQIQLY